jgi:hypothetical protein
MSKLKLEDGETALTEARKSRTPKRTTEEQLTDVLTKLLAAMEDRLAKMKARSMDCAKTKANLDNDIPALEKKIAAQKLAMGKETAE